MGDRRIVPSADSTAVRVSETTQVVLDSTAVRGGVHGRLLDKNNDGSRRAEHDNEDVSCHGRHSPPVPMPHVRSSPLSLSAGLQAQVPESKAFGPFLPGGREGLALSLFLVFLILYIVSGSKEPVAMLRLASLPPNTGTVLSKAAQVPQASSKEPVAPGVIGPKAPPAPQASSKEPVVPIGTGHHLARDSKGPRSPHVLSPKVSKGGRGSEESKAPLASQVSSKVIKDDRGLAAKVIKDDRGLAAKVTMGAPSFKRKQPPPDRDLWLRPGAIVRQLKSSKADYSVRMWDYGVDVRIVIQFPAGFEWTIIRVNPGMKTCVVALSKDQLPAMNDLCYGFSDEMLRAAHQNFAIHSTKLSTPVCYGTEYGKRFYASSLTPVTVPHRMAPGSARGAPTDSSSIGDLAASPHPKVFFLLF